MEINKTDFRYRIEKDDKLLAYNVITAKMYFFTGNTKEYLFNKLYDKNNNIELEDKYINYLIENNIIRRISNGI